MRRPPYQPKSAEIHSLDVWLRTDREPLRSFVEMLGAGGQPVSDPGVAGPLEVYLYSRVRGCISAAVPTSGVWFREEGSGTVSVRAYLTFGSLDDLISFRESIEG